MASERTVCRSALWLAPALAGLIAAGCSGDSLSLDESGGEWPGTDAGSPSDAGAGTADDAADRDGEEPPPEPERNERTRRAQPPVATAEHVYALAPSLNAVAQIGVRSLAVRPIPVGRAPVAMAAVQQTGEVVVLNRASANVSILVPSEGGVRVDTVATLDACNTLVISPDGAFAAVYYDNATLVAGEQVGSLQDVGVIDIAARRSAVVSVGFSVQGVRFVDGFLYVTTRDGLERVATAALAADVVATRVPTGVDGRVLDREIVISAAGDLAVARSLSESAVHLVDLQDGASVRVDLPSEPTDVDISADGDTVIASLRLTDEIAWIDVAAALGGATDAVTAETVTVPVGLLQIDAAGATGVTYSTVTGEAALGIVSTVPGGRQALVRMRRAASRVYASPAGGKLVVAHDAGAAGASEVASPAMSVIDLATRYAKHETLERAITDVAFTSDGRYAFVLPSAADGVNRDVWVIDLTTFSTTRHQMAATPESVGVTASGTAFVSQRVDSGRITFIDPTTNELRHVSAFQLNSYVD